MKRTIVFRPERCLMCLSCVLACQLKSLGMDDPRNLIPGQKPPRRFSMTFVEGMPWAERCRQCVQAPCVEACISGSIVRDDETSAVLHHSETCVGCGTCQLVCPFNAISRSADKNSMVKCNLCMDDSTPPCVGACRTGAIAVSNGNRDGQEKNVNFAKKMMRDRKNG